MTEYIVAYPGQYRRVEAESPEGAAQAVIEDDLPGEAHGVEVSVYERVLARHDVILGDGDE